MLSSFQYMSANAKKCPYPKKDSAGAAVLPISGKTAALPPSPAAVFPLFYGYLAYLQNFILKYGKIYSILKL